MPAPRVFRVAFGGDDQDYTFPHLDFRIPENGKMIPWERYGKVLNGELPVTEYKPIHLIVRGKRAKDWHAYDCAGNYGLISKTVIDVIGPFMKECFEFLPAFVNDVPFFCLRKVRPLDVLDREHSEVVLWDDGTQDIKRIKKYRFFNEKIEDPKFFYIPEVFGRFATEGIKTLIEGRNFKGFYFLDTDTTEVT